MIVVIGSPVGSGAAGGSAGGLAAAVAVAAAAEGSAVQVLGRVGDDTAGDVVLLDLARQGVGHVAMLRTTGQPTPVITEVDDAEASLSATFVDVGEADDERLDAEASRAQPGSGELAGLPLDAGDLDLALRYLPDYGVIVVAAALDSEAAAVVQSAAGWSGAQVVAVVGPGADPASLGEATVLERPGEADAAFASMVGRYAAGLDRGTEPGQAFAAASAAAGWTQPD